jgi:hypothetical protein
MASQGTLGKPYRVVYTSRNFVSGLSQINCRIIRPDLTISDSYALTEFTEPGLAGCYYYDFLTTEDDSLGDYIIIINNPEQSLKEGVRITYQSLTQNVALSSISKGLAKNYFGGEDL